MKVFHDRKLDDIKCQGSSKSLKVHVAEVFESPPFTAVMMSFCVLGKP